MNQTLIKSLLPSDTLCPAMKGSGVAHTKIHHAFARAPTAYHSLLRASSNYGQIEVREAGGGGRAACRRSHSKSVTEPRVAAAPASQCPPLS